MSHHAPPPGYKNSPVGVIPVEWEVVSFGEVTEKSQYGVSYPSVNDGTHLIIGMKNIQDGKLSMSDLARVSMEKEEFEKYKVVKGDFLFNRTNSLDLVGKSVLVETDINATFASYLVRFKLTLSKVSSKFVYYFFNSEEAEKKLKSLATKAVSQANINPTVLQKNFPIPIPPLPEQQKIAAILSTWDRAIHTAEQLLQNLRERNKGLAQRVFEPKEGWREVRLSEFTIEVSLRNLTDKELTVLSCTKYDGLVSSLEYFGRRIFSENLSTYKIVPIGHFAYATNHIEEGSIGYQNQFSEALISPMYTVFKTDDQVNDEFLFRLLKTPKLILEYRKRMEGSIDRRGGLRWAQFSTIQISLPPLPEQRRIAVLLATADREAAGHERRIAALREQKRGLMQALLTGRIRVKTE